MSQPRARLIWKVMALNVPVIFVVIGVVWVAIDYLAADYFMQLMKEYQISPTDSHRMFLESVHQYLLLASAVALVVAALVSFVLTQWVLKPLHNLSSIIRRMGDGDRDARARTTRRDELGDLAQAFNGMADHLQQVELLRQNMVIDVAHELRTPLTNVRGYIEGLRDQVVHADERTLNILESEVMRLVALVEDVLALARADAADLNLVRQPVNIASLIDEVRQEYLPQIEAKSILVDTHIAPEIEHAPISADRARLATVLRNLINNAIQYSTANATISIRVSQARGYLHVHVANPGEPIASEDLPFIFERFYRGEKSRSRESGGAGIGLAVVKRLVEAHGGHVGASSSADEGTTVWFTLPVQVPA